MKNITPLLFASSLLTASPFINAYAAQPLDEIVVTAELLEDNVLSLPNSVSVISNEQIEQRSAQHLEELLNLAPNVNFSTGASRGRFVQIRGIGERSEFQEPIINSVGLIVDGIDMTGIASAATTLDVQQVEILRGPQGTLFGANALAGLINIVSNKPTTEFYGKVGAAIENFGGFGFDAVVSGPTSNNSSGNSGYRLAVKHYESDGFMNDVFLGRDDTNNINEDTARASYVTQVSDNLNLDFTLFLADIDNGYDAFSLDNTRDTYSDEPGHDRQDTVAGSVKAVYDISDSLSFEGVLSLADSKLEYGYDEDWAHPAICSSTACDFGLWGFDWSYSSFDNYQRENENTSLDLRLVSNPNDSSSIAWVVGAYLRDQQIDLHRMYTYLDNDFLSSLETTNSAVYGQLDIPINTQWSFTAGLRFEDRDVDYFDNNGVNTSPDESLWGGRLALEYQTSDNTFYYGLISRGYKAGGFNLDGSIDPSRAEFDTETMLNYELGLKKSNYDGSLQLQASVFYQDRDDIQTKQSIVSSIATGEIGGVCPCSFTDFTDNAGGGTNYGIELELNWAASERLNLSLALGLLDTEFDTLLTFDHINADRDNGVPYDLKGREQAHAPSYQAVLGAHYAFTDNWALSGSIEAKDDFLFSDRHEARSDAYELLNMELSYARDNWKVALYGKNLTDETVKTRGFGSFGNDPRKLYETEPYNQFAAPRVVGLKAQIEFN